MGYKVLQYQKEVIEKGKVKPLNLIHGEEHFLVRTLIEKLKDKFGENFNLSWGDEIDLEDLYELSSEGSLFSAASEKAILLMNFDEFLKKLGRKRKSVEALTDLLKSLKTTKLFAVVNYKLTNQELSREPYKTFSELGDIILADKLPTNRIKEIVRKKFEREGGGIEEEALDLLVDTCQGNLMVLKNESEKLLAHADGRKITLEDVMKVCLPWEEYTLFEFVDSFFEKDIGKSLRILRDIYTKDTHALQVMGMLTGYITKLFVVHELLSEGEKLESALDKVGVKHQFAKVKFKGYLDKVPREAARTLIEDIYRLDYSVKVLFVNPEDALEKFTTEYVLS